MEGVLGGRKMESIHAIGGAVEPRNYSDMRNLEYVDLRKSGWKEIGSGWFRALRRLSCVEFPPELKTISSCAFFSNSSLKDIWFPEGLKVIENSAFCFCSELKEIVFPPELETLSHCSFQGCKSLKKVELPSAMKEIIGEPFYECTVLKVFIVGDVQKWDTLSDQLNVLGFGVRLDELHLTGRRWETLPAALAKALAANARIIGPNFIGRKLGKIAVMAE
jgi:hypothetical protein